MEWDDAQGTLKAWRRLQIGQLTVKVQPLANPSEFELHQEMLNGIRDKGLRVVNWMVSAKNDDEAATAAKIAAILEEPPRMGNSDLGVAFLRNQPAWQQRSQKLLKRLNVRGGEADSSLIAPLLAGAYADRIARRRGQEGRYQLANGMGAMLDADDALSRHAWMRAPLLLQGSSSPDARIFLAQPVDLDE